ncbi:hypothetical protein [Dactylosporangium sp. NPDC050588]|uniref:hypothetical protein n=1 Tax=Dactylosporangium sp. NPDC050588 TaxID=3157211 RepID=UPI0033F40033
MEIALTTPGARDAIAAARSAPRGLVIGAGTVLDAVQARAAAEAGAAYLVTPAVVPEAMGAGVPVVCGALTPTEMLAGGIAKQLLVPLDDLIAPVKDDLLRTPRTPTTARSTRWSPTPA